jgi:hypothetical protein
MEVSHWIFFLATRAESQRPKGSITRMPMDSNGLVHLAQAPTQRGA